MKIITLYPSALSPLSLIVDEALCRFEISRLDPSVYRLPMTFNEAFEEHIMKEVAPVSELVANEEQFGYSRCIAFERLVFVSGQASVDRDGNIVEATWNNKHAAPSTTCGSLLPPPAPGSIELSR